MNTAVQALIDDLKEFESTTKDDLLLLAVKRNEKELFRLNQSQLQAGVDGQGEEITPPYAPATIRYKIEKGQPYDWVTLRDTGEFYRNFRAVYGSDFFYLTSSDYKREKLLRKYGTEIFGLDEGALEDFTQFLKPAFVEEATKAILTNG